MKHYRVILASLLLLSACVDNGYKPVALERDFGRSVQQVTQAQYLNPKAAVKPPLSISKKGQDGTAGQAVMNTYRSGFGTLQPVQPVTNINLGGMSGSSSG